MPVHTGESSGIDDEKVFDGGWKPEILPDDPEKRFAALEEREPSLADIAAGIAVPGGAEAAAESTGAPAEQSSVIDATPAFEARRRDFMQRLGVVREDAGGGRPGGDPSPLNEALAA